jgi:thiamine pyrophosphate-dependent acetolactate synthase large subunit-like protein
MATKSVANLLVDTLVAAGVKRVYGLAGDSPNGITESIRLGLTVETPDQVRPMITQALNHDGPALVEVLVHRQELMMPPKISLDQLTVFSLYMLKALLSGHGDEIIDLAKINLFR